jgi:hypothetical protein
MPPVFLSLQPGEQFDLRSLTPNPSEVSRVFTVPVAELMRQLALYHHAVGHNSPSANAAASSIAPRPQSSIASSSIASKAHFFGLDETSLSSHSPHVSHVAPEPSGSGNANDIVSSPWPVFHYEGVTIWGLTALILRGVMDEILTPIFTTPKSSDSH